MNEMALDLTEYRASTREQDRVRDLLELLPASGRRALDVGARDGYISRLLAERYGTAYALDLEQPKIDVPGVQPVKGDVTALEYPDDAFDVVLCAEVLEHIPSHLLAKACAEMTRVAAHSVVIGVPYRQDLRAGRTTCTACNGRNPPWGHVNAFDEHRLSSLFPGMSLVRFSYVGTNESVTNAVSAALMDFAGNPYGTYGQEEGCVHCGAKLTPPARRSPLQKAATRGALVVNRLVQRGRTPGANWIHARFDKPHSGEARHTGGARS